MLLYANSQRCNRWLHWSIEDEFRVFACIIEISSEICGELVKFVINLVVFASISEISGEISRELVKFIGNPKFVVNYKWNLSETLNWLKIAENGLKTLTLNLKLWCPKLVETLNFRKP
jgi:hypothetical protein